MYAVENIEKFIKDHSILHGEPGKEILARAKKVSFKGYFSGGQVQEVFASHSIAKAFIIECQNDPEHITIFAAVIKKAGMDL